MKQQDSKKKPSNWITKLNTLVSRLTFIVFSLYLLVWASSPVITHQLLSHYLETNHSIVLSKESSLRYNPFLSRLTINNLTLKKQDISVFTIQSLTLELNLHRLIQRQLYISDFKISGLTIDLALTPELEIAGIILTTSESELVDAEIAIIENKEANYQLILPKMSLEDGLITLQYENNIHHLVIDDFSASDVILSEAYQKIKTDLLGRLDEASLKVDLNAEGQNDNVSASININLSEYNFTHLSDFLPKDIEHLKGSFNVQFGSNVNITEDLITLNQPLTHIEFNDVDFKNNKLAVNSEGFQLEVSKLSYKSDHLFIDKINFKGLKGNVFILKDETLSTELTTEVSTKVTTQVTTEAPRESSVNHSKKPAHTSISINEIVFSDNDNILIQDDSATHTFEQNIQLNEFTIKNINNNLIAQESPFKLAGTSNKFTTFDLSGYLKPFSDKTNLKLDATIKEFSLPPINRYVGETLGLQFDSGELDTEIKVQIVDSKIDGSTHINIRGLTLNSADNYDSNSLNEHTAMPLNMALGVLKDSDDNLELDIPMTGDIDSPSFGFGSFINLVTQKAIKSAATTYLLNTFVPYAEIISISLSAGEFILKTRFEDLLYQPGQSQPSDEHKIFIAQFVQLLKDKNKATVKVCAISTQRDLLNVSNKFSNDTKKLTYLKTLSKERMDNFKGSIVNLEIDSSRIILCAPKATLEEKSKPRLEFSLL